MIPQAHPIPEAFAPHAATPPRWLGALPDGLPRHFLRKSSPDLKPLKILE